MEFFSYEIEINAPAEETTATDAAPVTEADLLTGLQWVAEAEPETLDASVHPSVVAQTLARLSQDH